MALIFTLLMSVFFQRSVLYTFWHLTYTRHLQASSIIHYISTIRKGILCVLYYTGIRVYLIYIHTYMTAVLFFLKPVRSLHYNREAITDRFS